MELYFIYDGFFDGTLKECLLEEIGMRQALQQKIQLVERETSSQNKTVVLIKATPGANYKNIVDALDEMVINGVTKYVLLEADSMEMATIAKSAF
jgi:biopolymer transport protein ExbD